jgi:hypothetical protein
MFKHSRITVHSPRLSISIHEKNTISTKINNQLSHEKDTNRSDFILKLVVASSSLRESLIQLNFNEINLSIGSDRTCIGVTVQGEWRRERDRLLFGSFTFHLVVNWDEILERDTRKIDRDGIVALIMRWTCTYGFLSSISIFVLHNSICDQYFDIFLKLPYL